MAFSTMDLYNSHPLVHVSDSFPADVVTCSVWGHDSLNDYLPAFIVRTCVQRIEKPIPKTLA